VPYNDQLVTGVGDAIARWAMDAASAAVLYLFNYMSRPTDPVFTVVTPAYNRVLAIALLLAGGVISFALAERVVGGRGGAGADVVPRTVAASTAAVLGLPLVRLAVSYSDLLAAVWNRDVIGQTSSLASHVHAVYQGDMTSALGSALGLFIAAALTVLLAVLVHVELVLRAALIALTTTMLPLACVMAIWPRLAGTVHHMTRFLVTLFVSKFVVATAVYLGFAMVVQTFQDRSEPTGALMTGLATLTAAALAPVVLLQGVRFAEVGAAHAARGFAFGVGRTATNAGGRIARSAMPSARRVAAAAMSLPRSRRAGPPV